MKSIISRIALTSILSLFLGLSSISTAHAQIPGAILSAGALGGIQSSNVEGIGSGTYYALRGGFGTFFGEVRRTDWGNSSAYIRDNGILAGMDMSLLGLMISGAVGVGSADYQAPTANGITPGVQTSTSFLYEAQAMYQFDIVRDFIRAGAGVNYLGESNGVQPITGWGAVAGISIGL
jgi:hypothetical protein